MAIQDADGTFCKEICAHCGEEDCGDCTCKDEHKLVCAFIQGAKWWEFQQRGATMWQSDQDDACAEAERRLARGVLGMTDLEVIAHHRVVEQHLTAEE